MKIVSVVKIAVREIYIYLRAYYIMWIEIGLLVLAVPVGLLIAYLTKEELKAGRRWFESMMIASALLAIWFFINQINYVAYTFLFVFVVALVSLVRSYDKK